MPSAWLIRSRYRRLNRWQGPFGSMTPICPNKVWRKAHFDSQLSGQCQPKAWHERRVGIHCEFSSPCLEVVGLPLAALFERLLQIEAMGQVFPSSIDVPLLRKRLQMPEGWRPPQSYRVEWFLQIVRGRRAVGLTLPMRHTKQVQSSFQNFLTSPKNRQQ